MKKTCATCIYFKHGVKPRKVDRRINNPHTTQRKVLKDGYCDHPQHPWGPNNTVYKHTTSCKYHLTTMPVCNWCFKKITDGKPLRFSEELWEGDPTNLVGFDVRFYHKSCYEEKWRLKNELEEVSTL